MMARIEDNGHRNEIWLTRSEMRFCWITLALVATLLTVGWIHTLVTWR